MYIVLVLVNEINWVGVCSIRKIITIFLKANGFQSLHIIQHFNLNFSDYLLRILDWSEVWALLLPIAAWVLRPRQAASLKPVLLYLLLALVINIGIDAIMMINMYDKNSSLSNNPLYNVHSLIRYICFSLYFIGLPHSAYKKTKIILFAGSLLLIVLNFVLYEQFFKYEEFSGNLLTGEAYVLLIYCMLYYLETLKDDEKNLFLQTDFWVVTGLGIYVVVNFFVFLFYQPMIEVDFKLAINIWNVHNLAFIIFCLFIMKAIYGSVRYQYSN